MYLVPQGTTWYALALFHFASTVCAKDECQPIYWEHGQFEKRTLANTTLSGSLAASSTTVPPMPAPTSPLISSGYVTPGQVNDRFTASTEDMDVNYYTCTALALKYGISVETFFKLNPGVHSDCGNIEAATEYCVAGFIEPLRAYDGLCGPPNNNATCLGSKFGQCCNAKTFKCGSSPEDCADGTCYEGACVGESVYTTDGNCGREHGYKMCAGVWGDCCNAAGKCGTGPSFCGYSLCQLGNCSPSPSFPSTTTTTSKTSTSTSTTTTKSTSTLGCAALDAYCLCNNVDFKNGIRDCSNGACGTAVGSTVIAFGDAYCSTAFATHIATTTGVAALPSCGQTCFNNMVAQYSALCCASPAPSCLCENANFGYGLRDCAIGACGTAAAPSVIAYGNSYCASATAAH